MEVKGVKGVRGIRGAKEVSWWRRWWTSVTREVVEENVRFRPTALMRDIGPAVRMRHSSVNKKVSPPRRAGGF